MRNESSEYCRYNVSKVEQNLAFSLGGYLWAISSIATETLQVRCLLETHVVPIQLPLQILYIGNRCEGYSPSLFILAKADQAVMEEIESCKDYFLEFNDIYTPDEYIGIWYEFCTTLMDWENAQKLVEWVEPLGTLDFSILSKHIQPIPVQKGVVSQSLP